MHHLDPMEIGEYLRNGSQAITLFRQLQSFWPAKSAERAQIGAKIEEAEKALKLSEANLAKALGYQLCYCELPPGIMLSKGFHPRYPSTEIFKCNKCGKQKPPNEHFDNLDETNRRFGEHNRSGGGWMAR